MGKQTSRKEAANKDHLREHQKSISLNQELPVSGGDLSPASIVAVEDIDLKLYIRSIEKLRIYSAALVDE